MKRYSSATSLTAEVHDVHGNKIQDRLTKTSVACWLLQLSRCSKRCSKFTSIWVEISFARFPILKGYERFTASQEVAGSTVQEPPRPFGAPPVAWFRAI